MKTQDELIDLYLCGKLKGADMKYFKRLLKDDEAFARKAAVHKIAQDTLRDDGLMSFMGMLNDIKQKYRREQGLYEAYRPNFAKAEGYEKALVVKKEGERVYRNQSGAAQRIEVLEPQNDSDEKYVVRFKLAKAIDAKMVLTIDLTDQKEMSFALLGESAQSPEVFIAPNTETFEINIAHFPPGRYYWELKAESHSSALGVFLVKKELMEEV